MNPHIAVPTSAAASESDHGVELYWLPLGAGAHVVRRCGRVYEAVLARWQHRPRHDLYHAALQVRLDGRRFVIELAPAWASDHTDDGVVAFGPVGARPLGRSRWFRYEVRCWEDGTIPDVGFAVGGPRRLSQRREQAARLLEAVPRVPTPTWGRDESGTGEMWNSNSVVAWLLACSGHDLAAVSPPAGGRAPGWAAGWVVAGRGPVAGRPLPETTPA